MPCIGDSKQGGLLLSSDFLIARDFLIIPNNSDPCEPGQLTFRNESDTGDWFIHIDSEVTETSYLIRLGSNERCTLRGSEIARGTYRAIAQSGAGALHWFRSWREKS